MPRRELSEDEAERIAAAEFDPSVPLATLQDIRSRVKGGYVVYNWQFAAFIDAYDKLLGQLERLKAQHEYLAVWAKAHKPEIARYRAEQRGRIFALGLPPVPDVTPAEAVHGFADWLSRHVDDLLDGLAEHDEDEEGTDPFSTMAARWCKANNLGATRRTIYPGNVVDPPAEGERVVSITAEELEE